MRKPNEWTRIFHNPQLDIDVFQAFYTGHAFPRHSHDYYVICLIKRGFQSFTFRGSKYYTPPGGIILINPGEAHTGEAADDKGFEMLCLYPSLSHMQETAFELTGHHQAIPYFTEVRTDQRWVRDRILSLHSVLTGEATVLEIETRFYSTLAQLILHQSEFRFGEIRTGNERDAVRRARKFLEERYDQNIDLAQLAAHVSLSPYYLLRAFRAEVGMPPHAYLESVRIRRAQTLIESGMPLVEIALEVGFSSQSHFTNRFKQIIGITPGQYAQGIG